MSICLLFQGMNKIISISKISIITLLCMQIISACTKVAADDDLTRYIGSYTIDSIYWTGEIVDINGDGIGERDLINEYYGLGGFVKDWVKGSVMMIDDTTVSFNSTIPVYVTDGSDKYKIKYYDIPIQAIWHGEWGKPGFATETYFPATTDTYSGLINAYLEKSKIQPASYELHVKCCIPDKQKGQVEGTAIFTFSK